MAPRATLCGTGEGVGSPLVVFVDVAGVVDPGGVVVVACGDGYLVGVTEDREEELSLGTEEVVACAEAVGDGDA